MADTLSAEVHVLMSQASQSSHLDAAPGSITSVSVRQAITCPAPAPGAPRCIDNMPVDMVRCPARHACTTTWQVCLVGVAERVEATLLGCVVRLDDGTGAIDVVLAHRTPPPSLRCACVWHGLRHRRGRAGVLVCVHGWLQGVADTSVRAAAVVPVTDSNALTCHLLAILADHLRRSRAAAAS